MSQQAEANDVLTSQKNEINRLHEMIDAHRNQTAGRKKEFKEKISEYDFVVIF